ncbi:MAG: alpha/beta fold hydrolase BchO [Pseudomonadota bacterium]
MWTQFDRPRWSREGQDWPNREHSLFVEADDVRWHVQRMGRRDARTLILVHGTGASTHSFRDLMPILAEDFDVIAMDLPGHGFTEASWMLRPTLPRIATVLAGLLRSLDVGQVVGVGHSAGAAILARMALDHHDGPAALPGGIVSLNGAFMPFRGMAGQIFPSMAKMLFMNPFVPRMFAATGRDPERVARLLDSTGSKLDARGQDLYRRLFTSPGHVSGALAMMANWDLDRLIRDLPRLRVPLTLVTGDKDGTVSPADARDIQAMVRHAERINLEHLGHLAHEEAPESVADIVRSHLSQVERSDSQKVAVS